MRWNTAILLAAAGLLAAACAINPATGKRELMLIGERQEIDMGRDSDRAIVASMGAYDDEALRRYVERVGRELAARSERPDLPWTFRVIDDPVVNAFALPGGYVYVTRGILAYLNTEAELAAVLGHEIGHVTARHGASQMSKAQLAQLGLGVGSMVSSRVAQYGGLAEQGLGMLFLKYSRDDERQADDLGLRYLLRTGYDPRPMPGVFRMLKSVGDASGGGRVPAWLSSHPDPEMREERVEAAIAATGEDYSGRPAGGAAYLAAVDGVVFGEDPRQGFFQQQRFQHPELEFRFDFPREWKTSNSRAAVTGISPQEDAAIEIALAQGSPSEALDTFFQDGAVQRGGAWRDEIQGLPCASAAFRVASDGGEIGGIAAFVRYRERTYRLMGLARAEVWDARRASVANSLGSFARLTDPAALAVEPRRVRVVEARAPTPFRNWNAVTGLGSDLDLLARINQIPVDGRVDAGRSYKLLTSGKLP